MAKAKRNKLTELQRRTVDKYHSMKRPNKLKAMQSAGSTMKGKSGSRYAQRLFDIPHVREYHESLSKQAKENAVRTEAEIISEMEKLAFSNIEDYLDVDEDGEVRIKSFDNIGRDKLTAVKSVKVSMTKNKDGDREYQTTTFELIDKKGSLELLGRRFGCFPNRRELTGKDGGPLELNVKMTKTYKKK